MMLINQKAGSNASSTIKEIHEVLTTLAGTCPKGRNSWCLPIPTSSCMPPSTLSSAPYWKRYFWSSWWCMCSCRTSSQRLSLHIHLRFHHRHICRDVHDWILHQPAHLFALVLAIGTVVDDAIVVVEAVQAKFDEGYQSAVLAADDA